MSDLVQPIAPEIFGPLVAIAIAAGQQRTPHVQSDQAPPRDPFMQAAVAIREELADQQELFDPVMNRFTALMYLYTGDRLGQWVRPSPRNPKAQDIHPAVIHVAAQFKVNKNGRFPIDRFLQAVNDVAERYPAWTEIET